MKLLFFLALLGCALALQNPVEYEYQYTARILTGIHSARPQCAGTGIKAKVRITMQEDGSGEIQLQDVQVGEGNTQVQNDGRQPLPIDYSPIQDKSIEQPYKAHFRKQDGETVLEVPENDLLWVTNVRRGVANFFRIAPIIQPGSVPHPEPDSNLLYGYSKTMDTFAGRCQEEYTITPATQYDTKPTLREDIQSKRTPKGPGGQQVKLEDDFHYVQASIDFSTCSNRVFLSQTGAGNLTNVTSSSYRDVASRSHVGEYLLQGQPGKFRMQRGDVESAVVLQPFGVDTAKMIIMSNQSMELISAKPAPRNVMSSRANLKPLKTWNQQLQSPNQAPQGYAPRFIQYNTTAEEGPNKSSPVFYERMASGFRLDEGQRSEDLKSAVIDIIEKIVQRLRAQNKDSTESPENYRGSEDGRIAQGLQDCQHLLRDVDVDVLRELDEKYKKEEDKLHMQVFVDSVAVAASGPAQQLLLEKIHRQELSDNRTASIFFNLANNIHSPEKLEQLVDLAASLQEEKNVTASLFVKNNLALIIRRLCVSPDIKTYSHMMYAYGKKMCDRSKIVSKYLPTLQQKIESSSKIWVKILNVIAAADLGARESIPILEKVARGDVSRDIFLRYAAIHGMSAANFDNSSRDQIFNVLQPIAESRVEDYRIRQIAYDSLLTFMPNVTFIQRMIFSSHNEPSQQVQSYISWVVDSLSRIEDPSFRPLSTAARNALALTRYMPASSSRPMSYIFSRYINRDQVGSQGDAAWLSQYKSSFPREIYYFVAGKYGRFGIPLLETVTFGNNQAVHAKLRSAAEEFTKKKGQSSSPQEQERQKRLHEEFQAMHGGAAWRHNMTEPSDQEGPDLYHFSRLWRTSEVFLPLTNELYQQTKEYMQAVIRNMGHGEEQDVQFFKYLNPVESNIILPTPPGLFIKLELNTPTVLFGEVRMMARTTPSMTDSSDLPRLRKINFRAEGIVKAVTKTNSYARVMSPWNNKTALSGVDLEKTVSMPLKYEIEADLQEPAQIMWAQLTPKFNHTESKIPVIKMRNLPFTALAGLIPTLEKTRSHNSDSIIDLKPVTWLEKRSDWHKEDWSFSKANTGLNAQFEYLGEAQPPFRQSNVMNYIREPSKLMSLLASPTIKNYEMSIYQPSEQCETKSIGFALRFLQQQGSGEPITAASASKPVDFSPDDSLQQREQKLQKFSNQENYEVSAQLNFTGPGEPKVYEVAVVHASQQDQQSQDPDFQNIARKIEIAILEKNHESTRPKKTCLVVGQVKPQLTPMPRSRSVSAEKDIRSDVQADVYQGQSCAAGQQPIVSGQATLEVTKERLDAIRNITGNIPMSRGNSSEFYRLAVYDDLQMEVKWTEPSPTLKNLTLKAQDLIEGYLYPKIVKNRLQPNQPNQMSVRARRYIGDNRADARVELPKQTVQAESVNVVTLFDPLVSFSPNELQQSKPQLRPHGSIVQAPSGDGCLVKSDHVQTFDGVGYQKPMSACPITAVKVSQGDDNIAVITSQPLMSSSGPQQVKIVSTKGGLEINVTGQSVQINGQPLTQSSKVIKDASGNTIARVSKAGDLVSISLPNKMDIAIKQGNLVMIKLDQRFKNIAKGLCGDYNSDTKDDLRGTKGCIYQTSQGNMFAASWVVDESSCQEPPMKSLFEQVHKFQEKCPKGSRQAVSGSQDCSNPMQVYPIGHRGDTICVGMTKVMHCNSGCHPDRMKVVAIESKCWSTSTAPMQVRENLSRGYMTDFPAEPADTERQFAHKAPTGCSPMEMSSRRRAGLESANCGQPMKVYPVTSINDLLCVGEHVVSKCRSPCHPGQRVEVKLRSKCWSDSTAPPAVIAGLERGYMEELPEEKAEVEKEVVQLADLGCVQASMSGQQQTYPHRRNHSLEEQLHRQQHQQPQEQLQQHQQRGQQERLHPRQLNARNDPDCVDDQAYPVRAVSSLLCITKETSKVCKPECQPGDTVPTQLDSKCWQKDQAPDQVKQSERQGYSDTAVQQPGQSERKLSIQVPRSCYRRRN